MQWEKWKKLLTFKQEGSSIDKKKVNPFIVGGIIAAIVFLAGSSFLGSNNKQDEKTDRYILDESVQQKNMFEDYSLQIEKRLSEALSEISGAGRVNVIVNMDDSGEKVLATDNKNKAEHYSEENSVSEKNELEESTVMTGQGSGQQPFVIKEKKPNPTGIIVIAEGARNESIRLELFEAVKALYGISPHRIKVVTAES